jgi:hypothetical protein
MFNLCVKCIMGLCGNNLKLGLKVVIFSGYYTRCHAIRIHITHDALQYEYDNTRWRGSLPNIARRRVQSHQ